jgi:hypothetical protein
LREERKDEDTRKGSLGCKPRLVGQHTHLGNRMKWGTIGESLEGFIAKTSGRTPGQKGSGSLEQ